MSHHFPSLGALQQSAFAYFLIDLCSLVVEGVPPCWRHHQIPTALKLVQQSMTFFPHLLSIVTLDEVTIKHLMYTWKVPFLYTERACVLFSGFKIHLGKFLVSTKV